MADLAGKRLRTKTRELVEALHGRFREHHAFVARTHLDLVDQHTAATTRLTERIEVVIDPICGRRC